MAIHITRWKPDTCSCIVEYSWDDSEPQDQRRHNLHRIASKCSAHNNLSDQVVFETLTEENPRKNLALNRIMEKFPHLTEEVTDEQGNVSRIFKKEHEPTFSFDSDRKLSINIPNLSSRDKSLAQAEINKHLPGKVELA